MELNQTKYIEILYPVRVATSSTTEEKYKVFNTQNEWSLCFEMSKITKIDFNLFITVDDRVVFIQG